MCTDRRGQLHFAKVSTFFSWFRYSCSKKRAYHSGAFKNTCYYCSANTLQKEHKWMFEELLYFSILTQRGKVHSMVTLDRSELITISWAPTLLVNEGNGFPWVTVVGNNSVGYGIWLQFVCMKFMTDETDFTSFPKTHFTHPVQLPLSDSISAHATWKPVNERTIKGIWYEMPWLSKLGVLNRPTLP